MYLHVSYDLAIIDEIHKFLTDTRYTYLLMLRDRVKFWLALIGIIPPEKERDMIVGLAPIIDEITAEEAVRNNWIAPSIQYNLKLEFTDVDKIKYIKYSHMIGETLDLFRGSHLKVKYDNRPIFESDFDLIYACYTGKKLPHGYIEGKLFREMIAKQMGWSIDLDLTTEYGKQRDKYWNPNNIYDRTKAFQSIIRNRNELISNNDVKLKAVIDIVTKYDVPTIIFNENIDFVTQIADSLGVNAIAYHSRIESRPIWDDINNDWVRYKSGDKAGEPKKFGKDTIKSETIQGMISGKYKYLVTAKALDEGLTIPNLELVIITSGSTNPIQQGQRSARGLTIDDNNPTKQTKIFNLYFDDILIKGDNEGITIIKSRDKQKLIDRQVETAIELLNLDEIS